MLLVPAKLQWDQVIVFAAALGPQVGPQKNAAGFDSRYRRRWRPEPIYSVALPPATWLGNHEGPVY